MLIDIILSVARSLIYICIGLEALFLAYSYNIAGKTKIIKSLSKLFLSLGVVYVYLGFLPILRIISVDIYLFSTHILTFLSFYILNYLDDFRKESFNTNQSLPTPSEEDIKGNKIVLILKNIISFLFKK